MPALTSSNQVQLAPRAPEAAPALPLVVVERAPSAAPQPGLVRRSLRRLRFAPTVRERAARCCRGCDSPAEPQVDARLAHLTKQRATWMSDGAARTIVGAPLGPLEFAVLEK